ncbi:hypothetical protein BXY57_2123 [Thermoflavifilum aggregans]|uniref:Uncharacterized protein n=1 Tax=Thermoflavifilum aggregans TaxID=454188 RepID=A0A2M9CXG0_9BACT|nr:hypothetical protein [Thermoflavifilum aggregans]PJJ76498.1 hypothetical protein BXY57_2123 [Thermoflavifilum aggregans]
MQDLILQHLEDPYFLEALYREHKNAFKKAFAALYPSIQHHVVAQCWHARLRDERDEVRWGTKNEWLRVMLFGLLAGVAAKLSDWLSIRPEDFYPRFAGFIVFPFLMLFFIFNESRSVDKLLKKSFY